MAGDEVDAAFFRGVESVTSIRCIAHRAVPALNRAESAGGECAVCAIESLRGLLADAKVFLAPLTEWLCGCNYHNRGPVCTKCGRPRRPGMRVARPVSVDDTEALIARIAAGVGRVLP